MVVLTTAHREVIELDWDELTEYAIRQLSMMEGEF